VERESNFVSGTIDEIGYFNGVCRRVKLHRTPVARSRGERGVTVVFGGPTQVGSLDLPRPSVPQPHEGPALGRLTATADFNSIMCDRRPEVRTPFGLTVVAVRSRVGKDFHTSVPNLHR
jgi:hypothetical protein